MNIKPGEVLRAFEECEKVKVELDELKGAARNVVRLYKEGDLATMHLAMETLEAWVQK